MSIDDEIRAGLAAESKREAKGVDWAYYDAVVNGLEEAEYEIETLKAKIAELDKYNMELQSLDNVGLKGQANAIREAVEATKTTTQTYDGVEFMMCEDCDLLAYADKLEKGEL